MVNMRNILRLLGDALVVNGAILLAFFLKFGINIPSENLFAYKIVALPATITFLGLYYIYDLYSKDRLFSSWEVAARIISASFVGILALVTLSFAFRSFAFPRVVIFISWLLITFGFISWRLIFAKYFPNALLFNKVLFVGIDPQFSSIASNVNKNKGGEEVVGFIQNGGAGNYNIPHLGPMNSLYKTVKEHDINRIVVTSPSLYREFLDTLASTSIDSRIKIDIVPDLYEILIGRMDYSLMNDVPLITITKEPVPPWVMMTKRLFDMVFGGFLLVLLSPLFAVISMLVKISGGKVFYSQERLGKDGKTFYLVKFRSMVENAENSTGPVMASTHDVRTTPVGRFLRRWRLDELPQLVNIVRGEMSFVGPRPERPFFVNQYRKNISGYDKRFSVKPGLTGLSQVSGFYDTSAENKLKYDLIYISHLSLMLDVRIILQTLRVVLEGKGVN